MADPKGKIDKTKKSIDAGVDKITSPIEKSKKALDAAKEKIEAPFKAIKAKQQQAKSAMDAAKNKVEAAKKILDIKKFAHEESKKNIDKTFGSSIGKINKAKNNVEDSQKEFQKAGDFVKSLIAKIEAKGGKPGAKT